MAPRTTAANPADADRKLGQKLKRFRRRTLGITQKKLGALLGTPEKPVPHATISRWELFGRIEHPGMLFLALAELKRRMKRKTTNNSARAS
jgi:transcriptional regulator with XRE-family HTH domain